MTAAGMTKEKKTWKRVKAERKKSDDEGNREKSSGNTKRESLEPIKSPRIRPPQVLPRDSTTEKIRKKSTWKGSMEEKPALIGRPIDNLKIKQGDRRERAEIVENEGRSLLDPPVEFSDSGRYNLKKTGRPELERISEAGEIETQKEAKLQYSEEYNSRLQGKNEVSIDEESQLKETRVFQTTSTKFVEQTDELSEQERITTKSIAQKAGAGGPSEREELDFYDFFLEFSGNKRSVVNPEDPICIVVAEEEGEEFKRTVQHICRDIYRERVGGLPFPERLSPENKMEIERRLTEDKIALVEGEASDFLKEDGFRASLEDIEKDNEMIARQVRDFYSQSLGFLLLSVNGYKKAKKLADKLEEDARPERPYIIPIEQKVGGELKKKISKCACGFLNIDTEEDTLDSYFLKGERMFKDQLKEKVKETPNYLKVTEKDPNPDIKESAIHLSIKAFVVRHLAKERNLNSRAEIEKSEIETEPERKDTQGPHPDVLAGRNAFEVETLFGEGTNPGHEIIRKIKLYHGEGYKLNFVLPNLTFLRYLPLLKGEQRYWRSKGHDIGFYALDLEHGELISLADVENYIDNEIRPFVAKPKR